MGRHVFSCLLLSTTVLNLLYKAEKPSVHPSIVFWRSISRPWLHESTSHLLEIIAMSSGMTKFFKEF